MADECSRKDCKETLGRLDAESRLVPEPKGRYFESEGVRVRPSLVFPLTPDSKSLSDYLSALPEEPSHDSVILMQAGAVSLGLACLLSQIRRG